MKTLQTTTELKKLVLPRETQNKILVMKIRAAIRKMGNAPRFIGLTYQNKSRNERARYLLEANFSYLNLVEKSLVALEIIKQGLTDEKNIKAAAKVEESLRKSLSGTQDKYTKKDVYLDICNGLKINLNDFSAEIAGLLVHKTLLAAGDPPKERQSSEEVLLCNAIRDELPIARYRSFCLDSGHFESARVNGETLELT